MATAIEHSMITLHPDDNISVAARNVPAGTEFDVNGRAILTLANIDMGHKVATRAIPTGAPVKKFGQTIGFATCDIAPGAWVHTHNVEPGALSLDYAFCSEVPPDPTPITGRTFMGYRRADGRAATRNYIGIISTVNCSAHTSKYAAARFDKAMLADYPNIDGVLPLIHKVGCAMQYGGEDHLQLNRTLAGFAKHANIGAYLLVGLGCETGQGSFLAESEGLVQIAIPGKSKTALPLILNIQDEGGIAKTIERAVSVLKEMLPEVWDPLESTCRHASLSIL